MGRLFDIFRKIRLSPYKVVILTGERTQNEYSFPVDSKYVKKVAYHQSPAHRGKLKHSVDFLFTLKWNDFSVGNVPILAAAKGTVVAVYDKSNKGGPHKKYWKDGNYVMVKHDKDEFTFYEHLRYKGAKVKRGQEVKAGQIIGFSGNTGYTFLSHLHFEVRKYLGAGSENYKTLKIKWKKG